MINLAILFIHAIGLFVYLKLLIIYTSSIIENNNNNNYKNNTFEMSL